MRLFIALPITSDAEQKLASIIGDLKGKGGKVKWVDPKQIHLTLKFLGETSPEKVEPLKTIINGMATGSSAIQTSLTHIGAFPNPKQPRVVWIDIDREKEKLMGLANKIDEATHRIGWEKEQREFKTHLTLGRIKVPENLKSLTDSIQSYRFEEIPLTFSEIVLFQSTLTPQGPIYKRLHTAAFK